MSQQTEHTLQTLAKQKGFQAVFIRSGSAVRLWFSGGHVRFGPAGKTTAATVAMGYLRTLPDVSGSPVEPVQGLLL